jgi:hypothetical protein
MWTLREDARNQRRCWEERRCKPPEERCRTHVRSSPHCLGSKKPPPQASSMLDGSIASHASSTKPTVAPDKRSKVPRTLE